jgi:small subunit ribosomal protein S13
MAKAKKKDSSAKGKGKGSKKPQKQNKPKKEMVALKVTKTERIINQPTKKTPSHIDLSKESKDFRHVVRISGRDVPGFMPLKDGFVFVFGVGRRMGKIIKNVFLKKTNKQVSKVGYLNDKDVEIIEDLVLNIDKEVPAWTLNRVRTITGEKKHMIMADLKLENRKDLQRLGKIKSYRGLRLQWGLTVRGQKTKNSFRKSGAVGVSKKK